MSDDPCIIQRPYPFKIDNRASPLDPGPCPRCNGVEFLTNHQMNCRKCGRPLYKLFSNELNDQP